MRSERFLARRRSCRASFHVPIEARGCVPRAEYAANCTLDQPTGAGAGMLYLQSLRKTPIDSLPPSTA